jgi:hypothetical protein
MATRYKANTAILFKIETTPGVDAAPTGAADAVLVTDFSVTPLDAQNVDRQFVRPYFGGYGQLVGTASVKIGFSVELAGSGTAGTAPQWGDMMIACAHAEASLTTPARVEYTPASTGLKTATIYYYDDGVLHKVLGAQGNVKLSATVGNRPTLSFDFVGLYGGVSAATAGATDLSAWKAPVAIAKPNVTDITLGCTYSAGAITGGTVYASTGLDLDWGNSVSYNPLVSSESIDLTNRNVTGKTKLDLSAADEVTWMGNVRSNVTQSLGMVIGTATGNKIVLYAPSVQLINPSKEDLNGKRVIGFDLRLVPVNGNDEIRIACV